MIFSFYDNKMFIYNNFFKRKVCKIIFLYRFGMFRDAEKQFKSSIKQQEMIDSYLWMGKVFINFEYAYFTIITCYVTFFAS